jgi:hypothetical protein
LPHGCGPLSHTYGLLLLTTSQSLLLLDTDSGLATRLDSGRGLYYGLARDGDHLYVAARNRLVSSDVPAADERGEILIFDRRLQPCGSLRAPFPLRDLHEIAWHGGKLWATASHDNLVAVYDGSGWQQWYPLGEPRRRRPEPPELLHVRGRPGVDPGAQPRPQRTAGVFARDAANWCGARCASGATAASSAAASSANSRQIPQLPAGRGLDRS